MNYLRLELFGWDIQKQVDFYCGILNFHKLKESEGFVSLINKNVRINLGSMNNLPKDHPLLQNTVEGKVGRGVEIVIEVDNLEEVYSKVTASGYPISSSIQERSWGARDFRVVDPEGYYIRFTE